MPLRGLPSRLSVVLPALLAGACASSEVTSDLRAVTPAPGTDAAFATSLCQDGLCWLDPSPQGNPIRAVTTSPTGTSWAVGDHGVVLRNRGSAWEVIALPKKVEPNGSEQYRNLLAVDARADDDVWISGEGGALFHFDGRALAPAAPPGVTDAELHAIRAFGPKDVWVASRRSVWRWDGAAWTEVLESGIDGLPATIVGMWASAADDVWLLGATTAGDVRLWSDDGQGWREERVKLDTSEVLVAPGAAVAISGASRGQPWVAFEQRVLARTQDGAFRTVYQVPFSNRMDVQPVTALHVRTEDDAWIAFTGGAAKHGAVSGVGFEISAGIGVPGYGFGAGPGERTFVLRAGGRISDPLAAGASRAIDAPPRGCAPSGSRVACIETTKSTISVRANARGDVATFEPRGPVTLRDAKGTRELPTPEEQGPSEIRDVALGADGTAFLVTRSSVLYRAAPGASRFTKVAPLEEVSSCRFHAPAADKLFATCLYTNPVIAEVMELRVYGTDGALLSKDPLPQLFSLDPPVAVTASGAPVFAALTRAETGDAWAPGLFQRVAGRWKKLDVDFERPDGVLVSAWGETVVAHVPADSDRVMGAELTVLDAAGTRRVRVPVHGLTQLVASEAGVFGERAATEALSPAFPEVVRSAFVLSLGN